MHLRVLVNGTVEQVDKWKRDLAAQHFKYVFAKGQTGTLQLGVRTMEIIDLCFPEDQLQTILQLVKPNIKSMYGTLDCKKPRYPGLDKLKTFLRKFMKLDKIPEYTRVPHCLDKPHVAVHGIGLKKDLYDADGIELI